LTVRRTSVFSLTAPSNDAPPSTTRSGNSHTHHGGDDPITISQSLPNARQSSQSHRSVAASRFEPVNLSVHSRRQDRRGSIPAKLSEFVLSRL
jgi:hypothetical protein